MRAACAVLVSIAVLSPAACEAPPTLSGTWVTYPRIYNLSGAYSVFHLHDAAGDLSGNFVWGGFIGAPPESSAVTGRRSGRSFQMAFNGPNGLPIGYTGQLEDRLMEPPYLEGTWIAGSDTSTALFGRP
jgi:hypothetical protein